MDSKKITIIQGHPDPATDHLAHALAQAYTKGAEAGRHTVRQIVVAHLDFPLLRRKVDWDTGTLPPGLQEATNAIGGADHLVIIFPLWLGTMPAMLKGFLEQVLRPGFAFERQTGGTGWKPALKGKSVRVIVTMGMPALFYRWFYGANGVRGFERNILGFCGISPIRETLLGLVDGKPARRESWLRQCEKLGRRGQ